MKFLVAFGRFWYDFLVGDDWKIAVSVVLVLIALVLLLRADVMSEQVLAIVGAALLMLAFTVSLLIDVRRSATKR